MVNDKSAAVADTPKYSLLCLLGVVITIAAYAFFRLPVWLPAAAAGTAFFGIAGAADKKQLFTRLFTAVVFIAGLFITGSVTQSLIYLSVFFPGGLALSWCLRHKTNINGSVARVFSAFAVFTVVAGFFWVFEYGTDMRLESVFAPLTEGYKEVLGAVYDNLLKTAGFSYALSGRDNFVYLIYTETVRIIPYIMSVMYLAVSVLAYWLCKLLYSVYNTATPDNCKFFGSFIYIRVSRAGGGVYMAASVISLLATTELESMFFTNITMIMSVVFCYAGASLIGFLMKMYGLSTPLRWFVYFLLLMICMLPMGLSGIVSMIGLIDSFWHLRRFIRPLGSRTV